MRSGSDIADWLRRLDLMQYEQVFRDNAVDIETLSELSETDLEKLGVLLGHRKKMLKAIAALSKTVPSMVTSVAAPIPSTPERTDGAERRQLTVMFCDLVSSTEMATRLDPEDMREVLSAYTARASEVIGSFGGFVANFVGDGILVYFGYPRAREDDAERALRTGLALVDNIGRLEVSCGRLRVRIGIATGLVVVGDLSEDGKGRQHEVVGETPNLAARLQTLADPDTVLAASSTRQLVGNLFEFRERGVAELKGFPDPVPVWQVLGSGIVGSRFEALHTATLPALVGREEELELMLRRWHRATAGDGQIVLLSGEAGIGKSRIIAAFEERLSVEHHTAMRYFCSPHHQDSTLYPVIAQLERAARFAHEDTAEARLDKLEALLSQSGESQIEEIALLADLLGLPAEHRYPPTPGDPQRKRELTLSAFVHQLEGHARQRPVLALFEDMHWIDSTTLELLDMVVGRVPHLPVMLCITCRPEFHPPWTGLAHVSTLTLGRLGQREASMLVAGVAGHKALPDEIMQRIIGRADGIPLFVEELTKTLLEGGMLREEDDRYVLDGSLPAFAIPSSLHASLMARLDRLSPVKEIAQIGAAIGREFSYELVAGLARRNDRELREALDQLVASGLIFRRGSPPAESYVFKHALVQDAAYGSLLRRPRQDLHARIGKVLEQRFPETAATQPEILAHHYTEAGLADPAIDYWRRAGQRSLRRSANVEGVTHLTHAIELIGSLPATSERNRRELDLHLSLGQMMRATQGYAAPDTLRVFSRARDLLGEGATVDEQKTVLYGLWSVHYVRAEHTSARAVADQCLALAPQAQDADVAALANMLIGCSLLAMGALTDSRHHLGRTRDLSLANEADPIVSRFSQNNGIAALSYLAWALWPLGYLDQAVTAARDAVARARRTGHVPLTAFALYVEGFLGAAFGAEDDAVARVSEAVAYCVEHRVTAYEHWARFCEGVALARHGEAQNGIEVMRDAMNAAEKLTADFLRPLHLGHLAAVHTNIGQPDLALGLLDQAIHSAVKTGERFFEAELYRLKGEALCALGSRSEGETELERALTVARRQQARLWELRAAASLSGVLRDRGNAAKARDLLGPVYDWFTEGFDTPDLVRARAALGVLG